MSTAFKLNTLNALNALFLHVNTSINYLYNANVKLRNELATNVAFTYLCNYIL